MTENETPISIGEMLSKSRIDQGLSVSDIAERINLSQSVVIDIEEERFSNLKARIYFSGYVRAYAGALGLDQNYLSELVSQLDPVLFSDSPRSAAVELPVFKARRQFQLNWFRWATVFIVLLLITTTVYWWSSERHRVGGANVIGNKNVIQLQVSDVDKSGSKPHFSTAASKHSKE